MGFIKKYRIVLIFILLIGLSALFHFWRISSPARPIGDEAFSATYAAKDVLHKPYFDVHPPLGKLILSMPLFFADRNALNQAAFVHFYRNIGPDNSFATDYKPADYGNFPYVSLRWMAAFFGLMFLTFSFLFIRRIAGNYTAILALFFMVFENALLLNTRLALMDGIYMAFGFMGLFFFFRNRPSPVWGGIFGGLALSIKLTSLTIFGPILIAWIMAGNENRAEMTRDVVKFIAVALGVLLILWFSINLLLFPLNGWVALVNGLFGGNAAASFWGAIQTSLKNILFSVIFYTGGGGANPMMSPWYGWPLSLGAMNIYGSAELNISLLGNIFVWYLGTLAVITALINLLIRIFKRISLKKEATPALIFIGSYVLALAPFFTIVSDRPTFIYQYFPALIFAIALAAFFIIRFIENKAGWVKAATLIPIVILTVYGFLISAPFTYGL